MAGPRGIRFDFNHGCRVLLPQGDWQIRLIDLDTGRSVAGRNASGGLLQTAKRYFVRWRIEVSEAGEPILAHDFAAAGRDVLIALPALTIGDAIAWFPYAVKFKERHGCRLTCAMPAAVIPLFRDAYPDIDFITHREMRLERFYATYWVGVFLNDAGHNLQPRDFRLVRMQEIAADILGVDAAECRPKIALSTGEPPIAEPYVCIGVQATAQRKYWNHPDGWREVVRFLKARGYRVVCIDKSPVHGRGFVWNHIPHGAEDETGDRPLLERARWLMHARFFIGLSSGLAWLAWAVRTPVVMISGFTDPGYEFHTPWRITNSRGCNSCWNDPLLAHDFEDFFWCPRHAGTARQFECSRLITPQQVIETLHRMPGLLPAVGGV